MLKIFSALILFIGAIEFIYLIRTSEIGELGGVWLACLLVSMAIYEIDRRLLKLEAVNQVKDS